MKRAFLIIAVTFLSLLSTLAQKEYKPAYIITNNNDTIDGLVNISTDIRASGVCLFKLNENSEPVKYKPEDIIGYRFINDKFFVTKLIPVGDKSEKRFVEYLINGIISIYSYSAADGVRYFVQKEGDETLRELIQSEKEVYVNNERYINIEKPFINALSLLTIDAPELNGKIEDASLSRKSLISISKDYQNIVCKDHSCITYEKKLDRPIIELGAVAAFNYADLQEVKVSDLDVSQTKVLFTGKFSLSKCFAYGLSAKVFIPPFNNKFYLKYEALVVKHEFNTNYYTGNIYDIKKGTIISYHLRNSFTAGLYLSESRIRPFIEAGGFFYKGLNTQYKGFDDITGDPLKDSDFLGVTLAGGISIKLWPQYYMDITAEVDKGFFSYNLFNINEFDLKINIPIVSFNKNSHSNK